MKLERLEEMFFAIWCLVMPVTSVLLVPSIQGTVPAYMMAFASIVFVSMRSFADRATLMRYLGSAVLIALLWTVLLCGSQLGHLLSSRVDFGGMYMIDMDSPQVLFRPTIFTQTLYLAACSMIALYFRFFFREEWMKYIAWGAWLLAIYAIYEWSYYLVFQTPGDFLVNRTFNDGAHSGSWSQGISVGPFSLLRVKSTLGEPAFFSVAALPYLLFAIGTGRRLLSIALFVALILSTSTSAYLGLALASILMMVYTRRVDGKAVALIVMTVVVFGTLLVFFPNTFDDLFGKKFSGENTSGSERLLSYDILIDQLGGYSLLNWVFGIGIGYAYYSVFLSSLINTGLIGMGVFFYIFLKPILRLDNEPISLTTKIGLSCVLFIYIINVSDFYVPPTWMFLGLGYWLLDRRRRAEISSGERDDPPHEEGNVSQSNLVPMEVVR